MEGDASAVEELMKTERDVGRISLSPTCNACASDASGLLSSCAGCVRERVASRSAGVSGDSTTNRVAVDASSDLTLARACCLPPFRGQPLAKACESQPCDEGA